MNNSQSEMRLERPCRSSVSLLALPLFLSVAICGGCVSGPSSDKVVPLPLVPAALAWDGIYAATHGKKVLAVAGEQLATEQRYSGWYGVSDSFGTNDLRQLHERLNSTSFQAAFTNYTCGDPAARFTFNLTLYKVRPAKGHPLYVEWWYSPYLDPFGPDRCLSCGVHYLVTKAFAEIPAARRPDSSQRIVREPHCDCSKRPPPGSRFVMEVGQDDWVTYPGPDERLW